MDTVRLLLWPPWQSSGAGHGRRAAPNVQGYFTMGGFT